MPLTPEEPAIPEIPLVPNPEAAVGLDPSGGAKGWDLTPEVVRAFLMDLIPEGEEPIRWVDSRRNPYEAPPLLPMDQQFLLVEHAKRIGGRVLETAQRARFNSAAMVRDLLGTMDRALVDEVNAIFEAALPDQLKAARERYGKPDGKASAFFPGEELLKAIVPFFARPLAEVVTLGARALARAAA